MKDIEFDFSKCDDLKPAICKIIPDKNSDIPTSPDLIWTWDGESYSEMFCGEININGEWMSIIIDHVNSQSPFFVPSRIVKVLKKEWVNVLEK